MSSKLKDLKQGNNLVMSCASRGRNPSDPSDRTAGCPTEQRLEPNFTGIANCITSVEKDCYILEINIEKKREKEKIIYIPYDDYNSRIPNDIKNIGSITTTIGHSALRNGWKILEITKGEE